MSIQFRNICLFLFFFLPFFFSFLDYNSFIFIIFAFNTYMNYRINIRLNNILVRNDSIKLNYFPNISFSNY